MKKVITLCLILSLILTTGCGCNQKKKENGKQTNTTTEKKKQEKIQSGNLPNKEVDGIKFTEASISYVDDMSVLVATVKNTTKKTKKIGVFDIIIKDSKGKEIITVPGFITEQLDPNEEKPLTAAINMDLTNAADIEYKF